MRNQSQPKRTAITGTTTTSESAIGTAANATSCRAIRNGASTPTALRAEPEREAEEEVAGGAVEQSADERQDDEHEPVDRAVVHHRAPGRGEDDRRHPREDHDRSTGSERASTSRSSVSASAANTARGAVSTFGTRRHQARDAASPAAARSAPTRSAACDGLETLAHAPRVRVADVPRIGDSAIVASVDCAACGEPNEGNRKFCGECGAPLQRSCPSCGTANAPGVKFCGECGTPLETPPESGPRPAPQPQAERRLVSVLFADLVGFTAASDGRDAEETRELLSRYFDTSRRLIELYGGTVEKFIGDAVMAVWGTPVATEDDAERAVRAALDLVAAVTSLGDEVGAPGLRARAGVLTGEAAVTLGAERRGHGRRRSRQHRLARPVGGRARHGARRRLDAARDRADDRVRRGRRVRAQGQGRPHSALAGAARRLGRARHAQVHSASRRRSSAETASCVGSRISSTPRPRSGARTSSR